MQKLKGFHPAQDLKRSYSHATNKIKRDCEAEARQSGHQQRLLANPKLVETST